MGAVFRAFLGSQQRHMLLINIVLNVYLESGLDQVAHDLLIFL